MEMKKKIRKKVDVKNIEPFKSKCTIHGLQVFVSTMGGNIYCEKCLKGEQQ